MKHVKAFEKFRIQKNREEIIKESVFQVNDLYKVKTMIDLPQSLINAYVKKVKDTTGKNLRQFFGDVDIAEEIIKYVTTTFLDIDKIPGGAIMGGQTQAQTQGQVQVQTEPQAQTEAQPQAQPQVQTEAQPQAQEPAEGEFEEPTQGQAQPQGQAQEPAQGQAQEEDEEEELPL
jgi:glucan-binding YG repeat protein